MEPFESVAVTANVPDAAVPCGNVNVSAPVLGLMLPNVVGVSDQTMLPAVAVPVNVYDVV